MVVYYPKPVVDEVQVLLMTPSSVQPINTSWKKIMAIFRREGILKPKRLIHVNDIFPHPKNRAGMMINGFNAQANLSKVLRVGANRDELHGAVVIEFNPFPKERGVQINANIELITKSKGLIANPTGSEWCLSLGTGHMVASCRAARQGVRACFKNLRNDHGMVSLEILTRDPELKIMIDEGWEFDVLPWQVEATWSVLPEFAQRALNASNSVATDATEWEVAVTIGETYSNMEEPDWNLAIDAAAAGSPQCVGYIHAIRTLVENFGGGDGFPLILEQEEFYKTLGENKRLGEEFTTAIVDTKLYEFNPRLHVRHALIALNLTSIKIVDNVVKLVVKSDITALSGTLEKKATVAKIDDELRTGREFLEALVLTNRIARNQYTEILGLYRVRYGGFLINKGEKTFEGKKYETKSEIVSLLLQDAFAAIKQHDQPSDGQVDIPENLKYALSFQAASVASSNLSEDQSSVPKTIEEISGIAHAAKQKGFKDGEIVYEKKVGHKEGIYKIVTIGDPVQLQELNAFKDESQLLGVKTNFISFMSGWCPYKGDVPTKVSGDWQVKFPPNSWASKLENERCKLFIKLRELGQENEIPPLSKLVMLCQKPACLRAAVDALKGDIIILPAITSLSQILKEKSIGAIPAVTTLEDEKGVHVTFYISAPPQPKDPFVEKWKDSEFVSPRKWLEESTKDTDVNMSLRSWKLGGFVIPYIQNTIAVKKYDRLYMKK